MYTDDEQQQKIIELKHGNALVLAGPGCGKTHILAKRVYHAAAIYGHPVERMLCVTFTNRAAREMSGRIEEYLGYSPENLFIGNMHRFCLRFLYTNRLIDADTAVMDEEDQEEYLRTVLGLGSEKAIRDFLNKKEYLFGTDNDFPPYVIRRPYTEMTADDYERIAAYRAYQEENRLIDFDDILLRAFLCLMEERSPDFEMTGYDWAQVDEVQDMTPLQLAIVERLTRPANSCVIYFGDEQQAIFRFIGAGGPALEWLKKRCGNSIMRLRRNYRSPDYLVDMCNELAAGWLGIPRILLPSATDKSGETGNLLCYSAPRYQLMLMAAHCVNSWHEEHPYADTAVLVRTNKEGDELSAVFNSLGIRHFHISKQDLFHQIPFKTVWSHLAVVMQPLQTQPWARLLYQTRSVRTLTGASKLVSLLRKSGINPVELLDFDSPGVVERLYDTVNSRRTVVVFDTETTGLDIFSDDVVQIAAVRMKKGKIIPGSHFEVFISTDKPLPAKLRDDVDNPLVGEYVAAEKKDPESAFKAFIKYIGKDAVLAGHNIEFDKAILLNNIRRRTDIGHTGIFEYDTPCIDTLELSRLVLPKLKSYTLAELIAHLGINGVNSHLAGDDALATGRLLEALAPVAETYLDNDDRCHRNPEIRRAARRFAQAYGDFYKDSRKAFFTDGSTLAEAIAKADSWFSQKGFIEPIQRLDYLVRLIECDMVDLTDEKNFREQLSAHLYDLLAYAESDLFVNKIVEERVSIMTIHKAKGLEMPNVVLLDASNTFGNSDDAARLLYVAFSRARRMLAFGMSRPPDGAISTVLKHFRQLSRDEVENRIAPLARRLYSTKD